ncbi:MAG: transglycosylase SLT domain-containing protein [Paramuribaculum sp.]|nr:transglycosylase SLT domain-containing protein [Paramuribaculum sp.]
MHRKSTIVLSLLLGWLIAVALSASLGSCRSNTSGKTLRVDSVPGLSDTLRVVTLYSPQSYFIYRGEKMGFDYEMVRSLVDDEGWTMDLCVADSLEQAVAMLDSGIVDLIAYEVPLDGKYKGKILPAGVETMTTQVLLQPAGAQQRITDISSLAGKTVYAREGSRYMQRLKEINEQLGGTIDIRAVDNDHSDDESIMAAVNDGEIPLAVIDSDIAAMNASTFPGVDASVELGAPRRAAWAVAPGNTQLADAINIWAHRSRRLQEQALLLDRYFARAAIDPTDDGIGESRQLSPYDDLFRKYAAEIGWDWRLLAAQAHTESKFKPSAVSWAGARGLMQIMPATARGYGVSPSQLDDPETSIRVAVRLIADLDKWLKSRIPDDRERIKFILAAYNGGIAHVYDAIALARKYKMDPTTWSGNVEKGILMKTQRKYYRDPVVKYGYSRGRETYDYVRRIYNYYNDAVSKVPA